MEYALGIIIGLLLGLGIAVAFGNLCSPDDTHAPPLMGDDLGQRPDAKEYAADVRRRRGMQVQKVEGL